MKRLLLIVLLMAALPAWAGSHVILVQNSGWMEPFYRDPASPFKPLLKQFTASVVQPGDALLLASFNQSLPTAPSPRALLSTKADDATAGQLARAIDALDVARKPGGAALADTDLGEALGAALALKPGLIWLVTNNRNSPHNDQATAARNREFYQLIHGGAQIDTALAWPLAMPVQGEVYHANGLMIYVFAVGEAGRRQLDTLLASQRLQRLITEPPARLKPLDRDTVRLVPRRVSEAPGVSVESTANGLAVDVAAGAATPVTRITWQVENNAYPYTIVQATVQARARVGGQELPVQLADGRLRELAPGAHADLSAQLALPVAQMPAAWSAAALAAAGSAQVLPGALELRLEQQQLALAPAFRARMAALFPGDPLPDVFIPPRTVQASRTQLPLEVRAHAGSAPLLMLAGVLGGGLLLSAGAAHLALRPRRLRLLVNGEARTIQARVGSVQTVFDQSGEPVARLHTRLTGARLIDVQPGASVRLA
ncbi:hypothetical protein [Massilia sp. TS11]|uniref:hypothetical protein n=1 Tax=Massilia sp. TS11 TaxID=2908003 RepID=UPI001EDB9C00|nr:hypothetical protein [Massilia sp. TS11]MCG2583699.1 hypothetical protein [Massilia sp. TS11]